MAVIKMVLTNAFDPDIRVLKEAKFLTENNNDVEILCWDRESDYKDRPEEIIDGIKIKRYFFDAKYGSGLKQLKSMLAFRKEVKNYIKKTKPDIIYSHDLDGVVIAGATKKKTNKLVFDMHEYYLNRHGFLYNKAIKFLYNRMQKKSDYIVYVNDYQKQSVKKKNQSKLVYVPNFPIAEQFSSEKTESNNLRLSYNGMVRDYECYVMLMNVVENLENVEFNVHGIGLTHDRLLEKSKEFTKSTVHGWYDGSKENKKLYGESDLIFCVYDDDTTSTNGFSCYSIKFYEAIASCTPLIVSKGTVMGDFVTKYDIGYTVNSKNYDELFSLVKFISENPLDLKVKTDNIKKISSDYVWDKVVKNLGRII